MVPRIVECLRARAKKARGKIARATLRAAQCALAEFASIAASRFDRLGVNQHTADAVPALDANRPTTRRDLVESGINPHRLAPSFAATRGMTARWKPDRCGAATARNAASSSGASSRNFWTSLLPHRQRSGNRHSSRRSCSWASSCWALRITRCEHLRHDNANRETALRTSVEPVSPCVALRMERSRKTRTWGPSIGERTENIQTLDVG